MQIEDWKTKTSTPQRHRHAIKNVFVTEDTKKAGLNICSDSGTFSRTHNVSLAFISHQTK